MAKARLGNQPDLAKITPLREGASLCIRQIVRSGRRDTALSSVSHTALSAAGLLLPAHIHNYSVWSKSSIAAGSRGCCRWRVSPRQGSLLTPLKNRYEKEVCPGNTSLLLSCVNLRPSVLR